MTDNKLVNKHSDSQLTVWISFAFGLLVRENMQQSKDMMFPYFPPVQS